MLFVLPLLASSLCSLCNIVSVIVSVLFVYQMIDLSFIEAQQDFNDASKIR